MTDKNTESTKPKHRGYERAEEFYFDYANNVFLEPSVWDLKLVFGQLDQGSGVAVTEQRSAITVPWIQAKILNFLLSAHLHAYELKYGKIIVQPDVVPPEPPIPTEEMKKAEPFVTEVYEHLRKLRAEFFDVPKS